MTKLDLPPVSADQVRGNSLDCIATTHKMHHEERHLQDVLQALRPGDSYNDICAWAYHDLCRQWSRGVMAMMDNCLEDIRELARSTIGTFFKDEQEARQPQLCQIFAVLPHTQQPQGTSEEIGREMAARYLMRVFGRGVLLALGFIAEDDPPSRQAVQGIQHVLAAQIVVSVRLAVEKLLRQANPKRLRRSDGDEDDRRQQVSNAAEALHHEFNKHMLAEVKNQILGIKRADERVLLDPFTLKVLDNGSVDVTMDPTLGTRVMRCVSQHDPSSAVRVFPEILARFIDTDTDEANPGKDMYLAINTFFSRLVPTSLVIQHVIHPALQRFHANVWVTERDVPLERHVIEVMVNGQVYAWLSVTHLFDFMQALRRRRQQWIQTDEPPAAGDVPQAVHVSIHFEPQDGVIVISSSAGRLLRPICLSTERPTLADGEALECHQRPNFLQMLMTGEVVIVSPEEQNMLQQLFDDQDALRRFMDGTLTSGLQSAAELSRLLFQGYRCSKRAPSQARREGEVAQGHREIYELHIDITTTSYLGA